MATRQLTIHLFPERADGECPDCHFDALWNFKGYRITEDGVTLMIAFTKCVRCHTEKKRQNGEP